MADASQELVPGALIAGRYRVDRCVGRGGMGAVYLVRHVNTDERLALKVLHATVLANPMAVERFRREARAPAQIDSDHVVRVTDADTAPELDGAPFLVMEFLKGQDLEHEVEQHGALPPERVVLYLKQAARALDKAHGLGIVHRDLKPENLFLASRDDGTPCIKILDFGIAKITGGSAQALQGNKTETGTITGTPMYMSPEQIKGDNANVTGATDVWALGLIVVRLLSAGQYWTADTLPMLVAQIAYEPLAPPSMRGLALGSAFDEWFAKCCAGDPTARFKTAGEAIDALELALGLGSRQSQPHFGYTALAHTSPAMSAASPLAGSLQGASVSMTDKPAPTAAPTRKTARGVAIAAIGAVAIGAAAIVFMTHNKTTRSTEPTAALVLSVPAAVSSSAPQPTTTMATDVVAATTVRVSTMQPNVVRSAKATTSVSAVASAAPLPPPPSATASIKRPSDNDLLNTQH